ncbi:MBL fold metallo-hydrolase [Ferruginibacter sp.]|uniref:MBL fold metallo-hydrolase n=1 Tax=Ferruginibacter sp. TaxID=1940288 RepID=UPI00265924E0|nr:MBL fold metallo-hydrolase [Ferruginibacter sp.]
MNFLLIIFLVILAVITVVYVFFQQPNFGKRPAGERLEKIKNSPNYKNGVFQNLNDTPAITDGANYFTVIKKFFFGKSNRSKPATALPSQKTNLLNLPPDENVLVWFGHSSYFMQVDGKTFLVDPVFSGSASPLRFTTTSFKGSDVYTTDDFPVIDYLFITHDHWDHLDYETVLKLKPNIKKIITGLGTGEHLEYWGFDKNIIIEKDWNETILLGNEFTVNTTSARHFSGRGIKRNSAIWMSFVLTTPTQKIFIGGDSGYDTHFKIIGDMFGPFDLAILECGQYNRYWKYIHMMPEEVVQAGIDLKTSTLLPVHWAKFSLSLHAWDEPVIRVMAEATKKNMAIITPMIGETVHLQSPATSTKWWKNID